MTAKATAAAKLGAAGVMTFLAERLGGWDALLAALVTLAAVDVLTGIARSVLQKSDKTSGGGLSSDAMWRGGVKKALMFLLVAAATVADGLIGKGSLVRNLTVSYYIAAEGLSVCENAVACGLPLPQKLKNMFEVLREEAEKK